MFPLRLIKLIVIARLRNFVRYIRCEIKISHSYFLIIDIWFDCLGSGRKAHLNKLLLLQKRVLRMMHFLNPRTHVIPFILPIQLLFFEAVSHLIYDVSNSSHLKQSLKDFLSVVRYIRIIQGLPLMANITLNFHF